MEMEMEKHCFPVKPSPGTYLYVNTYTNVLENRRKLNQKICRRIPIWDIPVRFISRKYTHVDPSIIVHKPSEFGMSARNSSF